MLYQPTNIYPDLIGGDANGTIWNTGSDTSTPFPIRWKVNGNSPLVAYRIMFFANDYSGTVLADTNKVTLPTPFHGTDASGNSMDFTCYVPYSYFADAAETSNGYGKFVIRQWYGPLSLSVTQTAASVYRIKKPGSISITEGPTGDGGNYSFTGTWTPQVERYTAALTWTRWILEQNIEGSGYVTVQDTGKVWGASSYVWTPKQIAPGSYRVSFTAENDFGIPLNADPLEFSVMENYFTVDGAITASCDKSRGAVAVELNTGKEISRGVLSNNLGNYIRDGTLYIPAGDSVSWNEAQFDESWEDWSFAWRGRISSRVNGTDATIFSIIETNGASLRLEIKANGAEDPGVLYLTYDSTSGGTSSIPFWEASSTIEYLAVLTKMGDFLKAYIWKIESGGGQSTVRKRNIVGYLQSAVSSFTIFERTASTLAAFSNGAVNEAYSYAARTGDSSKLPLSGDNSLLNWNTADFSPFIAEPSRNLSIPASVKASWTVPEAASQAPWSFAWRFTLTNTTESKTLFTLGLANGKSLTVGIIRGSFSVYFGEGDLYIASVMPESGAQYDFIVTYGNTAETQNNYTFYIWKHLNGSSESSNFALSNFAGSRVNSVAIGGATQTSVLILYFGGNTNIYQWAQSGNFSADYSNATISFLSNGSAYFNYGLANIGTIFRTEQGKPPVRFADYSISDLTRQVLFYDYSAGTGKTYSYSVFYQADADSPPVLSESNSVTPCFWEWTLIEAVSNYELNVYRIRMNVGSGQDGNGAAPGVHQTFTAYPAVMKDTQNRHSGTLTGLIGWLTGPGVYADSNEVRDQIRGLTARSNPLYLRNRRGDFWKIAVSGEIVTSVNDGSYKQEVSVSIPWVEVGAAEECIYLNATTTDEPDTGGGDVLP